MRAVAPGVGLIEVHSRHKIGHMTKSTIASTDLLDLYEGDDYTGRYHQVAGERIHRAVARANLKPTDRVLDIGCGNGLLLPEIVNNIGHYDGVDFSEAFIREAKKRAHFHHLDAKKYRYYRGDVVEFCKHHKNYDKVFALDVVEHINDEELISIFSAVRASMNKGAILVAHTPNKDYVLERIKTEEQKLKGGHIALRNAAEYNTLFTQIGFRRVEVYEVNHYIRIVKPLHLLSYFPNKIIRSLFRARLLIVCEA